MKLRLNRGSSFVHLVDLFKKLPAIHLRLDIAPNFKIEEKQARNIYHSFL